MKNLLGILLISILMLSSCTENTRAKSFGGDMTITLDEGQKLIEATWKKGDLWYLTRNRRDTEPIETYKFKESSSFGVLEGTVTFVEQ